MVKNKNFTAILWLKGKKYISNRNVKPIIFFKKIIFTAILWEDNKKKFRFFKKIYFKIYKICR